MCLVEFTRIYFHHRLLFVGAPNPMRFYFESIFFSPSYFRNAPIEFRWSFNYQVIGFFFSTLSRFIFQIENFNLILSDMFLILRRRVQNTTKWNHRKKNVNLSPYLRGDFNFIFSIFMYIRYAFYMQHEYDLLENSEECKTQWPTKSPESLMEEKKKTA